LESESKCRKGELKNMANRKKSWSYKPSKPKVPDSIKTELTTKAEHLIQTVLKPKFIKEMPKDHKFNYPVDIFSKWYKNYFYFCAQYYSPDSPSTSSSFDTKFARMEYQPDGNYTISYMRHTNQWQELFYDLTMEEALHDICEGPHFFP